MTGRVPDRDRWFGGASPLVSVLLAMVAILGPLGWTSGAEATSSPGCSFAVALTAAPSAGTAPLLVHLNATVTSGSPSSYDWQFGDGSVWDASGAGASVPVHRYGLPGSYEVNVSVSEPECGTQGAHTEVAASPAGLSVAIDDEPAGPSEPLTVVFDVNVSGGSGTYVSVFWSFGGGGVGSGFPVRYTYPHAGTFSASVNVTDSDGHWVVATTNVVVDPNSPAASGGVFGGRTAELAVASTAAGAAVLVAVVLVVRARAASRSRSSRVPAAPGPAPTAAISTSSMPEISPNLGPAGAAEAGRDSAALVSRRPAVSAGRVQLSHRVILHIGAQGRIAVDSVGPEGLTQAGMARELRVTQNSLTNVLRRLVAAGVLVQDVRHVSGRPRRLRVYRFTERGESLYRDLRRPGVSSGPRSRVPGGPEPSGPAVE